MARLVREGLVAEGRALPARDGGAEAYERDRGGQRRALLLGDEGLDVAGGDVGPVNARGSGAAQEHGGVGVLPHLHDLGHAGVQIDDVDRGEVGGQALQHAAVAVERGEEPVAAGL